MDFSLSETYSCLYMHKCYFLIRFKIEKIKTTQYSYIRNTKIKVNITDVRYELFGLDFVCNRNDNNKYEKKNGKRYRREEKKVRYCKSHVDNGVGMDCLFSK